MAKAYLLSCLIIVNKQSPSHDGEKATLSRKKHYSLNCDLSQACNMLCGTLTMVSGI